MRSKCEPLGYHIPRLGVRTKYITVMVYDNEFIWGVHTRVEIVGNTRGREGF
jgi:hypothetical protein